MRSMSWRLSEATAGLKAPPQGMPSTTSRKASISRSPQISGTALAGPASPPGAMDMPAASARASRSVVALRARRSLPVMTSIDAGTSCGASGIRVATTSTGGITMGTRSLPVCAASGARGARQTPTVRMANQSVRWRCIVRTTPDERAAWCSLDAKVEGSGMRQQPKAGRLNLGVQFARLSSHFGTCSAHVANDGDMTFGASRASNKTALLATSCAPTFSLPICDALLPCWPSWR